MIRPFSIKLQNDVLAAVQTVANCGGILDISTLAEQVRQRNEAENVALEDILQALLQQARWLNLPIEFSGDSP
jgi:hypothetical protein